MPGPGSEVNRIPLVSNALEGISRAFKGFLSKDRLGIGDPFLHGPQIVLPNWDKLPTLAEHLTTLGFTQNDPIFAFVPKDRNIQIADAAASQRMYPWIPQGPGLTDSMETFKSNDGKIIRHTIFMRTAVETMRDRVENSLGFKPEQIPGFDSKQFHLFGLFHETGHTEPGNHQLPLHEREANADQYGIRAVEAQYPGSNIAQIVRHWRFIENGYGNGLTLDRTLKGEKPGEAGLKDLFNAHAGTSGRNLAMASTLQKLTDQIGKLDVAMETQGQLSGAFAIAANKFLTPSPKARVRVMQKGINAGATPLEAEAKQGTIDAYRFFAPKITDKALASVKPRPAAPGSAPRV